LRTCILFFSLWIQMNYLVSFDLFTYYSLGPFHFSPVACLLFIQLIIMYKFCLHSTEQLHIEKRTVSFVRQSFLENLSSIWLLRK
jgi:hypothetical protein